MTPQDVQSAYQSEIVTKLREIMSEFYTPEEFGMYLALPNPVLWGGKSVLDMIHEGRGEECVTSAQQLADSVYI